MKKLSSSSSSSRTGASRYQLSTRDKTSPSRYKRSQGDAERNPSQQLHRGGGADEEAKAEKDQQPTRRRKTKNEKLDELAETTASEWAEKALERAQQVQCQPEEQFHPKNDQKKHVKYSPSSASQLTGRTSSTRGYDGVESKDVNIELASDEEFKTQGASGKLSLPQLDLSVSRSPRKHSGTRVTPRQLKPKDGNSASSSITGTEREYLTDTELSTQRTEKKRKGKPYREEENPLGSLALQTNVQLPEYEIKEGDEETYERDVAGKKTHLELGRVEKTADELIEKKELNVNDRPVSPTTAEFMFTSLKDMKWALDLLKRDLRVWQRKYKRRDRLLQLVKRTYHRDVFFVREHFFRAERESGGAQWEPTFKTELPSSVELDELLMLFGLRGKIKAVDREEWDLVKNKATHYDQLKDEYDLLAEESKKLSEKYIRLTAFVDNIVRKVASAREETLEANKRAEKFALEAERMKAERDDSFAAVKQLGHQVSESVTDIDFRKSRLKGITSEEDVDYIVQRNVYLRKQVRALAEVIAQYEQEHQDYFESDEEGANQLDKLQKHLDLLEKHRRVDPTRIQGSDQLTLQCSQNHVGIETTNQDLCSTLVQKHFPKSPSKPTRRHSYCEVDTLFRYSRSALLSETFRDASTPTSKRRRYVESLSLEHMFKENGGKAKQQGQSCRRGSMPSTVYDGMSIEEMRNKYDNATSQGLENERRAAKGWGIVKDMSSWKSRGKFVFSNTVLDKHREWHLMAAEDTISQEKRYLDGVTYLHQLEVETAELNRRLHGESSTSIKAVKKTRKIQDDLADIQYENKALQKESTSLRKERDTLQSSIDQLRQDFEDYRNEVEKKSGSPNKGVSKAGGKVIWQMLLYTIRKKLHEKKTKSNIMFSWNLNQETIDSGHALADSQKTLSRVRSHLKAVDLSCGELELLKNQMRQCVSDWINSTQSRMVFCLNAARELERYRASLARTVRTLKRRWKGREWKTSLRDVRDAAVVTTQNVDALFVEIHRSMFSLRTRGKEVREEKEALAAADRQNTELISSQKETIHCLEGKLENFEHLWEKTENRASQFGCPILRKLSCNVFAKRIVSKAVQKSFVSLEVMKSLNLKDASTQYKEIPKVTQSTQTSYKLLVDLLAESKASQAVNQRLVQYEGTNEALRPSTTHEISAKTPKARRNSISLDILQSPFTFEKDRTRRVEANPLSSSGSGTSATGGEFNDRPRRTSTSTGGEGDNKSQKKSKRQKSDGVETDFPVSMEYYDYLLRGSAAMRKPGQSTKKPGKSKSADSTDSAEQRSKSAFPAGRRKSITTPAEYNAPAIQEYLTEKNALSQAGRQKPKSAPKRRRASISGGDVRASAPPYSSIDSARHRVSNDLMADSPSPWTYDTDSQ